MKSISYTWQQTCMYHKNYVLLCFFMIINKDSRCCSIGPERAEMLEDPHRLPLPPHTLENCRMECWSYEVPYFRQWTSGERERPVPFQPHRTLPSYEQCKKPACCLRERVREAWNWGCCSQTWKVSSCMPVRTKMSSCKRKRTIFECWKRFAQRLALR